MLDAEQIENIISMINDMGIHVYDEAPDAETLLMSDATPAVADLDVVEERRPHSPPSIRNSAAPPTRCACICVRWARSNS